MIKDSKPMLGDQLIDQQHEQLFDSLQRIKALYDHQLSDEKVIDQLTRLNELIYQHFIAEEALMKQVNMPVEQIMLHQSEHLRILEELAQIHLNIMYGRQHQVSEVIDQVIAWISAHTLDFDLPIQPYLAKVVPE